MPEPILTSLSVYNMQPEASSLLHVGFLLDLSFNYEGGANIFHETLDNFPRTTRQYVSDDRPFLTSAERSSGRTSSKLAATEQVPVEFQRTLCLYWTGPTILCWHVIVHRRLSCTCISSNEISFDTLRSERRDFDCYPVRSIKKCKVIPKMPYQEINVHFLIIHVGYAEI